MLICYASFGQAPSVKLFYKMYFFRGNSVLVSFLVGSSLQLKWVKQYLFTACILSFCSREVVIRFRKMQSLPGRWEGEDWTFHVFTSEW